MNALMNDIVMLVMAPFLVGVLCRPGRSSCRCRAQINSINRAFRWPGGSFIISVVRSPRNHC